VAHSADVEIDVPLSPDASPGRRLVIVDDRAGAGPASSSRDQLILDMAWTPIPGERPDLLTVRPLIQDILQRHNLFFDALDVLDDYETATDMASRLQTHGVTWWYQVRSVLALHVHERLLWSQLIAGLVRDGGYGAIEIRSTRPALIDVAFRTGAAGDCAVEVVRPLAWPPLSPSAPLAPPQKPPSTATAMAATGAPPVALPTRIRRRLGRVRRAAMRAIRWTAASPPKITPLERRLAVLDARLADLARQPDSIVAVVMAASFHTVRDDADDRRVDPYVSPILDRLAADGHSIAIVVIGLDHRKAIPWRVIEADPRLLPLSYVELRRPSAADPGAPSLGDGIRELPLVALQWNGFDLGPIVADLVASYHGWIERQGASMAGAIEVLGLLRPAALFTGWEAARTAWLAAARTVGVPTVAVQHGVIYPRNPDYDRAPHPGRFQPDVTCVFGPYERDLLIAEGGYDPDAVVATGSPRIDPDIATVAGSPGERETVRAELGVAPGDRILVVSAGRRYIGDTIHGLSMAGRLLTGPMPGVHIVVKLHPEAFGEDYYEELLAGMANAGTYSKPRLSVVRDIDLYRLLRSADAHLGLYSTVLTDAVLTNTPNMIAVGQAWADILGYVEAGVATPVGSADDVRRFMADPLWASAEDRARFLAAHFRSGDAVGRIAAAIRDASRQV
jgi:hypothetical protein